MSGSRDPGLNADLQRLIDRAVAGDTPNVSELLDCADNLAPDEVSDAFDWWTEGMAGQSREILR